MKIFGVRSSSFLLIVLTLLLAVAVKECVFEREIAVLPSRSFVLQFPDHVDLGELWLLEDVNCFTCGNGQTNVGRAMGEHEIRLPEPHWYVSLKMPKRAAPLMAHLTHPSLVNIGDINLAGSDVSDVDLKNLQGIRLRSIDLSGTGITGEGFQYLAPHPKWIFVDLTNCPSLKTEYLAHFRGWKRSTIRLVPYQWGDRKNTVAEQKLLDAARTIICDDQPEDICGVQIR